LISNGMSMTEIIRNYYYHGNQVENKFNRP